MTESELEEKVARSSNPHVAHSKGFKVSIERRSIKKVEQANKKIRNAWKEGQRVSKLLGERARFGAMKAISGDDASEAERLRKLRFMASRITETEIEDICEQCLEEARAWGPQFVIELSRLPRQRERKRAVKQALGAGWGLIAFKRHIRLRLAELGIAPRQKRHKVGRRRKIAWSNPAEIADELERLCTSFLRFQDELERVARESDVENWHDLLPKQYQKSFPGITKLIAKVQEADHQVDQ